MIEDIQTCNPKFGFRISDKKSWHIWNKYVWWKNGHGPEEYRNSQLKDIKDIMDIDSAMLEKESRQAQLNKLMSKIR